MVTAIRARSSDGATATPHMDIRIHFYRRSDDDEVATGFFYQYGTTNI